MDLVHVDSADGHLGGVKLGHLTATEAGRNGCGPQQGRLEVRPLVQALVHTAGVGIRSTRRYTGHSALGSTGVHGYITEHAL